MREMGLFFYAQREGLSRNLCAVSLKLHFKLGRFVLEEG